MLRRRVDKKIASKEQVAAESLHPYNKKWIPGKHASLVSDFGRIWKFWNQSEQQEDEDSNLDADDAECVETGAVRFDLDQPKTGHRPAAT